MGAFLRRSDTGAAEENAGGLELRFNESGEIVSGASNVDAAADLHEIGTFAQASAHLQLILIYCTAIALLN